MSFEEYKEEIEKQIEYERKEIERFFNEVLKIRKVLSSRSRTLGRLAFLKVVLLGLADPYMIFNPRDFEAKRGRKSKPFPIREVMRILEVSHRTAQDYVAILRALNLIDEWFEHECHRRLLIMQLGGLKKATKP